MSTRTRASAPTPAKFPWLSHGGPLGDHPVHRSPLRYPGGKSWLVPDIRHWLASLPSRPTRLIEPFAGGGAVALDALANGLVDGALIVERDDDVAALWHAMLGSAACELAARIASFELNPASYTATCERSVEPRSLDHAFCTLVRNRAARGGVLAPGAGTMRSGENGRGIGSRWYAETLAWRVREVATLADRLSLRHGDGLQALTEQARDPAAVFFIDPPYSAPGKSAGRRLYRHWALDHERLFELATQLAGPFLMTYDRCPAVEVLVARHGLDSEPVAMRSAHHAELTELVIGRDLDGFREVRAARRTRVEHERSGRGRARSPHRRRPAVPARRASD